jgi:hypothetical protein
MSKPGQRSRNTPDLPRLKSRTAAYNSRIEYCCKRRAPNDNQSLIFLIFRVDFVEPIGRPTRQQ